MIPVEVLREVRRIELTTRELVRDLVAGDYASAFRGRGTEFAEVREYLPGDDIRGIDWNVTARLGTPYIKRFHEERQLTLFLLVDVGAGSSFGSAGRSKLELAAEVAAVLALVAARHRDRVGAAFVSDRVEWLAPPSSARQQALRIAGEALAATPQMRRTDLRATLAELEGVFRRRAAVVVLSDFLDPSGWPALEQLRWRHDVVAMQLSDPRERELPTAGLLTLWDPPTGAWQVIDTDDGPTRDRFRAERAAFDAEFSTYCTRRGVDLLQLETDQPYGERLAAFFSRRESRRA